VRKSEEAILLMLNAMRTYPKMEKVREQVERILNGEAAALPDK